MRRSASIAAVACLLCAGCLSDYLLDDAVRPPLADPRPAPESDFGEAPDLAPPDFDGDEEPSDDAGGDPWDDLDPGNLSELLFGVAWSDPACIDAEIGGCSWNDNDECSPRYAIIDGAGQVLVEFGSLPHQWSWEWCYQHIELAPAGPGRFLATVQAWLYRPGWGDIGEHGQAWLADGVDGSLVPLAGWMPHAGSMQIATTGQSIELPARPARPVMTVLAEQPDRLAVVVEPEYCDEAAESSLVAVSLTDGAAEPWVWTLDELMGEESYGHADLRPWSLRPILDEDGTGSLAVVSRSDGCGAGLMPVDLVTAWSVDEGPLWSSALGLSPGPVRSSARSGGGAFWTWLLDDAYWWTMVTPDGSVTASVHGGLERVRPGPLIDPLGPVLVTHGVEREGPPRSVVRFLSSGQPVWEIERLRFGLQETDIFLHDLVLLQPLP